MRHFVERTCTVVRKRAAESLRETESGFPQVAESHALDSFRDEPAYVLLGSPGSGKTEAFRHEADACGGNHVSARDFMTLDPEPAWMATTLYIDGLDETRAGSADGRTPLDRIRLQLQRLDRPRFRLSCRAADWFGANDRERLKAVAPGGEVLVLRLDPLSDDGIREILRRNLRVDDPAGFVGKARQRGVADLLRNPQSLGMLAAAVAETRDWPRTRSETFEMACRKLVSEQNPEHQIACSGTFDAKDLLDGAGNLCAVLLLAGKAGVTMPGTMPDTNHPLLDQVPCGDPELLRRVVGTKLFESAAEGRLAPAHRQVAEFLAARRLAELIAHGLPVRRVLSLMTGFDGGVMSEFRGLAAWLAALSQPVRAETIERDPLGVVLYGDVQRFGVHEKRLLLHAVKTATDRNPWLVSYTGSDSPLRSLVGPDLEDDMRRALTDSARDEAHQSFVLLIVEAIRDAASFSELADPLMAIVRDDSWQPTVRCAALEAYRRAREDDSGVSATLRELLDDVYHGTVATPDDDLLGTLLMELYPQDLPAADVVRYLREPARRNLWTRYGRFWTDGVVGKSTIDEMVQLLDRLKVPMERVRAESGTHPSRFDLVTRPPIVLLRNLLQRSPESVSQERLLYWLDFAAWRGSELRFRIPGAVSDAEFFRSWLSDQPDVQKAIVEDGVSKCVDDRHFFVCMGGAMQRPFGATLPEDYGRWCADRALGAGTKDVADWFVWEAAAFVHNAKEARARHREAIAGTLGANVRLARVFESRLAAFEEHGHLQEGSHGTPHTDPMPDDDRFEGIRGWVRENAAALHANQCRPDLLYKLAIAYFDGFSDVGGDTPGERLQYMLGSGDELSDAALAGLRGAVRRPDLPLWTEVSKLAAEGRTHYLAYPFMAGLQELSHANDAGNRQLSDSQTRLALAVHFAVPRMRHTDDSKRPPLWLRRCLAREPDTVAEVWARCARAKLSRGESYLEDVHRLARESGYARLAKATSIPLLKAFPVRCRAGQLPILGSLVEAAMGHADRTQLLELIDAKIAYRSMNPGQRVYWLVAGLLVQPTAYGDRLESYVVGRVRRIQRLVEMTHGTHGYAVAHALRDLSDATALETLIRLVAPYAVAPPGPGEIYSVTWPIQADRILYSFINQLSQDASDAAGNALESLAKDDRLVNRRSELLHRLHRQKTIRREATFAHPGLDQVAEVLDNGRPANAADLAGIAVDVLRQVAKDLRDSSFSGWRSFWQVDQYDRATSSRRKTSPLHENGCRRALALVLKPLLNPMGVETQIGARYADDKRSDIRLSVPGVNVPVEIKKSCHRDLWSAIRTQLMAKYTRDPECDGYGIYVVFWFGETESCRPTPRAGPKSGSATELRDALIGPLTKPERRKISVCVIDVSKPRD